MARRGLGFLGLYKNRQPSRYQRRSWCCCCCEKKQTSKTKGHNSFSTVSDMVFLPRNKQFTFSSVAHCVLRAVLIVLLGSFAGSPLPAELIWILRLIMIVMLYLWPVFWKLFDTCFVFVRVLPRPMLGSPLLFSAFVPVPVLDAPFTSRIFWVMFHCWDNRPLA